MSTVRIVAVPVEEYLRTFYRPDCDYVEGRLQERNVGEWSHGRLQASLVMYLNANRERFRVIAVPEIRVHVAAARYRVADVCCLSSEPGENGIILEPPALVIEILSPDDTVPETEDRIEDYLSMGVPFVWLINPRRLDRAWIYEPGQPRREVRDRILAAGEIRVDLESLQR